MNSFLPPQFFCPVHGNQGFRTVCKWCDQELLPSRASGGLPRNTGATSFADPQQVSGQVVGHGLE